MAKGVTLKTLADVRRFLARITNELYQDQIPESRARALIYAGSVLKSIIESGDLEQRISQLEKTMKENQNETKF